jgi:NADPH-dependent glutamate synthase beta subunit-like oxidoreductase/NAD(P)H-flavin reductase
METTLARTSHELALGIPGYTFLDLHRPERLADLYSEFLRELAEADAELAARWLAHIELRDRQKGPAEGELLIRVSRHVSAFVARLFRLEDYARRRRQALLDRQVVYKVRNGFVKKQMRRVPQQDAATAAAARAAGLALLELLPGTSGVDTDDEERFAGKVWPLLSMAADAPVAGTTAGVALDALAACLKAMKDAGECAGWRMFREMKDLDFAHGLVHHVRPHASLPEAIEGLAEHKRLRDGFKLTDPRGTDKTVLSEVDQCVFCHEREKDSCSKGLLDKKTGKLAKNPLGIDLAGCPLDEHISEMHALYSEGDPLGALSLVMVHNPMCPGTGHRICNDCMKACIYQTKEPVNIPLIETKVLTDVLEMPWGPEIWLFLTRWNPLREKRPHALPYNGINVAVVGMGPAGYTLSHYLANEGFGVVGVDGLKVEPLQKSVSGRLQPVDAVVPPIPVESYAQIKRDLDQRVLLGFGGVSEYGITVRWDKNFLTLPYLSLLRRSNFELFGGVRFGGTFDLDSAWKLGFHHVAIASGAGKPTIVEMKNNLARGIRKASDFLMALQLSGAFKEDSLSCLQLRLPVVVIGGGLTGIDTATESLAYYPLQVEKMARRHAILCERFGRENIERFFGEEEREHLAEFLEHGAAVIAERARAKAAGEEPDFQRLVRGFGGVRLVYRKGMEDSPAYRLNHEEVAKALEEGITFVENMSPVEVKLDRHGAVRAVVFERQKKDADGKWHASGEMVEMAAGTVLVAAGTAPNVTYERERPGTFALDKRGSYFQVGRVSEGAFKAVERGRDGEGAAFLTSHVSGGRTVSVYGDNHPAYAGNVVKAMASARDGYHAVVAQFAGVLATLDRAPSAQARRDADWGAHLRRLHAEFDAKVVAVNRLTPTITEVVVHAPAQARNFEPGQFYRLQNFETRSTTVSGTTLALEGIALTGAWTDPAQGLLSMIVLEMGVTSRLCALLRPGEPVVVMGPTGAPTEIPEGETVLLAGGGLGNAVLFSIGRALRRKGNRVVYFAAFKKGEDLYKREEMESAADVVVWSTDAGEAIATNPARPHDRHFRGNVVQAMLAYANGELGETPISLKDASRLIVIGSDRMMNAVKESRRGVLRPHLKEGHVAIGSINSPMQCMMKEICAQCLCKQVDPATGQEAAPVFSCFNQDQELDRVDFENLLQRLRANSTQEKLANLWLDHLVHEGRLGLWTVLG